MNRTSFRTSTAVAAMASGLAFGMVVLVPPSASAATCRPGYPASVATHTGVHLADSMIRVGQRDSATVRVRSGAGTPKGSVQLRVAGHSYSLRLHGGSASHALPRSLRARHTYRVTASYGGHGCYAASSDSASVTVYPRRHR